MSRSDSGERTIHPCIVCDYDLRHDPDGPCPECGSTRDHRDAILVRQGEANHRQSQSILLGLGWMIILAILLSMLIGLIQMMD